MITQSEIKELLHYCHDTGIFTWRVAATKRVRSGEVAGCVNALGYVIIQLKRKPYLAHRLAFLYVHGTWPPEHVDHINRIKTDNRFSNLRLATNAENNQNQSIRSNNKSGHMGVSWDKRDNNWRATIQVKYKQIFLGRFAELSDAIAARADAKAQYHKFHPECVA